MRKIIFFLFAGLFISILGHAQVNKGSVLLGGGISLNSTTETVSNPVNTQNYLTVSPVIGVALRDNLVAGIELMYGHSNNSLSLLPVYENNNYGAELFIRRYLALGKGFYLFGQSGIYYRANNITYDYSAYRLEQKDHAIGINLYPGVSYAITKKFQLELGLANLANFEYSKNKTTNAGIVTQDKKSVNLNASASSFSNFIIGFRIFLAKK